MNTDIWTPSPQKIEYYLCYSITVTHKMTVLFMLYGAAVSIMIVFVGDQISFFFLNKFFFFNKILCYALRVPYFDMVY